MTLTGLLESIPNHSAPRSWPRSWRCCASCTTGASRGGCADSRGDAVRRHRPGVAHLVEALGMTTRLGHLPGALDRPLRVDQVREGAANRRTECDERWRPPRDCQTVVGAAPRAGLWLHAGASTHVGAAPDAACWHYGIVTPARVSAFLAPDRPRVGRLRYTREIWADAGPAPLRRPGRSRQRRAWAMASGSWGAA